MSNSGEPLPLSVSPLPAPGAERILRLVRSGPVGTEPPALDAISAADLRRDLHVLAGAGMRGREAGTADELRAAHWIAERARDAGLEPAGADGTYLQVFSMRRLRQSADSRVALDGETLAWGRDVVSLAPARRSVRRASLLFLPGDAVPTRAAIRGRWVATVARPPAQPDAVGISMEGVRYALRAVAERSRELLRLGAAGVVIASDPRADQAWEDAGARVLRGRYALDAGPEALQPDAAPVLWVRGALLERLLRPGVTLSAELHVDSFTHPSANVVARAPGSGRGLWREHVVFSAHLDHDGVGVRGGEPSIRHGADDNGSGCVALLAIGRAWARVPARRSALFVWHGAEERGLLGSRWMVENPPVPLRDLVAVLNGDMIGRNGPDSAALLGAESPNRNSRALVEAALAANATVSHFRVDTSWDRPGHPERLWERSDHLPYARAGVPAVFFTTQMHPDYHEPSDTPDRIDYRKLARMARWIYATGWRVANADGRPPLDGASAGTGE